MTEPTKEITAADLPVDHDDILPLETESLENIPKDKWNRFVRKMSGKTRLRDLYEEHDQKEIALYTKQIAAGELRVFGPGDSPQLAAEREAQAARQQAQVAVEVAKIEAAQRKAEIERRDRRDAEERARVEARIAARNGSHTASELASLERMVRGQQR